MTARVEKGMPVRFDCDGGVNARGIRCRANYEAERRFLADAWAEAKTAGWVNTRDGDGAWQHYCPTCKKELGDD
jgi:hypothetical protein